jgi:hypothetical protein
LAFSTLLAFSTTGTRNREVDPMTKSKLESQGDPDRAAGRAIETMAMVDESAFGGERELALSPTAA